VAAVVLQTPISAGLIMRDRAGELVLPAGSGGYREHERSRPGDPGRVAAVVLQTSDLGELDHADRAGELAWVSRARAFRGQESQVRAAAVCAVDLRILAGVMMGLTW
jgi:hypothetical protein